MNARGWVGEGFQTAKENMKVIFLFWAIQLPFSLLGLIREKMSLPTAIGAFVLVFALVIVNFILGIGLIHYLKLKREGQQTTLKTLWEGGLIFFWRYMGQWFVLAGLFVPLLLVSLAPFLLLLISKATAVVIVSVISSLVILGIGSYFVILASAYAGVILVADGERIVTAIKKSFSFTRPHIWILTRLFIFFFLISIGVFLIMGLLMAAFLKLGMDQKAVEQLVSFLLSIPNTFVMVASASAFISFYLGESKPKEEIPETGLPAPS